MSRLLKPLSVVAFIYSLSTVSICLWLQARDLPSLAVLATFLVVVSTFCHSLVLARALGVEYKEQSDEDVATELALSNSARAIAHGNFAASTNPPHPDNALSAEKQSLRTIIGELVNLEDQYVTDRQPSQTVTNGWSGTSLCGPAIPNRKQE